MAAEAAPGSCSLRGISPWGRAGAVGSTGKVAEGEGWAGSCPFPGAPLCPAPRPVPTGGSPDGIPVAQPLSLPSPDPQFVKATTLRHEEPHQDKIYYFFREDNPDKSPEAPRNISRVAQLCKVPRGRGGPGARAAPGGTGDVPAPLGSARFGLAPVPPSLGGHSHVLRPRRGQNSPLRLAGVLRRPAVPDSSLGMGIWGVPAEP